LDETGPGVVPSLVGKTRSIAVLPFVNASADPDNEYLSDGISDELINALTKVEGLRIASRTSVFALKGKPQDIRAIGALLGVSVVLEGTVRKSGDRLRITVQLSAAEDGRNLWSERYDRKLDDVFAVQDEIARTIVSTLRTTFLADIADPTPQRYTHNLEAYSLYLKGRYCWNKRSQEGVLEAISFFKQAIDHESGYALAYSGLSDSYALQVDYRSVPVTEGYRLAREYALKALDLDDTLPEAHTSLAWVLHVYDWDWPGAMREYARALELNPGFATAHHWYSFVLLVNGQAEQAMMEALTALELDPSSLSVRRGVGWLSYYTRRYEQALYHLRRAIAMNPTSEDTYRVLGLVLTQQGAYAEAERAFREAITLSPDLSYATAGVAHVLALSGRRREAEAIVAELEARARERYVTPVAFCIAHLGLRNVDQVFHWLDRAYEDRRGWLTYMKVDPIFDPVRDDPRFAEFLRRMTL
jgi:serine/threonine-protein kinase